MEEMRNGGDGSGGGKGVEEMGVEEGREEVEPV